MMEILSAAPAPISREVETMNPYLVMAKYAAILLVAVGLWVAGDRHGVSATNTSWQAKWNARDAAEAKANADAQALARAEEQRRQTQINKVSTDAKKRIDQANADAATANAAASSLRNSIESVVRRFAGGEGSSDSNATRTSKARANPVVVLANVLERADEIAGQLAKTADRARAAGLACEQSYDAVSQSGE